MYKISDDQNTVTMDVDASVHTFAEVPVDIDECCHICSLQDTCVRIAGHDGFPDFPFPCLDRDDGQNGYFKQQ